MINELKNLGLSDNEAKVYLAMLELGPSSVLDIARKAEINRPTAYVQIESLKKRGLVSTQMKGSKQLYIAESPKHLESMLDNQIHQVSVQKEVFSQVLPNLLSLYQTAGHRPTVRFFEGKEGLLQMQELILKSGATDVLGITPMDELVSLFPNHKSDYTTRRVKKGIHSKLIYTSSQGSIFKTHDEEALREARYVEKDKMPFSGGDLTIYGNNVAITALRGKISGVVIEHPAIAESFRQFFNFIWRFADHT